MRAAMEIYVVAGRTWSTSGVAAAHGPAPIPWRLTRCSTANRRAKGKGKNKQAKGKGDGKAKGGNYKKKYAAENSARLEGYCG